MLFLLFVLFFALVSLSVDTTAVDSLSAFRFFAILVDEADMSFSTALGDATVVPAADFFVTHHVQCCIIWRFWCCWRLFLGLLVLLPLLGRMLLIDVFNLVVLGFDIQLVDTLLILNNSDSFLFFIILSFL
jgi:hypothetical protein